MYCRGQNRANKQTKQNKWGLKWPNEFVVAVAFTLSGAEQGKIELIGSETYQCQYAYFSQRFPNSRTPVRVFASVNHKSHSPHVHDTVLVWVEDVSTSRFKTCVVTGGQGIGANYTIDWFAFQGVQSGVQHGQARYGLFTTGTKCTRVVFSPVIH